MEQEQTRDEIEIDIAGLFRALWSKKWIIILSGIILASIVGLFTKFVVRDMFQSSTQVYVNRQDSESLSYSDIQLSTQLTKDYKVIITSRPVLEQVIADLDLTMSYEELVDMISVDILTDTRILKISVIYSDPVMARNIVVAVRESATERILEVMKIEALDMLVDASVPGSPISPSVRKNTLLGGIAGGVISIVIILIYFLLDDTIKTSEDVKRYLEVPVLGTIPEAKLAKSNKKASM